MRRTVVGLLVLVLAAGVLSGCKEVKVGTRCKGAGAGTSGAWIVTCKNGRWTRWVTKEAGLHMLDAYLAQQRAAQPAPSSTQPPTTVPPVRPPRTTFGDGTYQVGTGPDQVPAGTYTTLGGDCGWLRGGASGDVLGGDYARGRSFMEIVPGDVEIYVEGGCTWTPAPTGASSFPPSGDGTYRVGIEIAPGPIRLVGGVDCVWLRLDSLDGSSASVIGANTSNGPQVVDIHATDVAFEVQGCGPWSVAPALPA